MIPKINAKYSLMNTIKGIVYALIGKQKYGLHEENNTYCVNHARTGLRMALSALQLPANSKIGVGMYNCYTVMNAIKIAGYQPVFIDVTTDFVLDLKDLESKKNQLSALIVTHLFGIPNDMTQIAAICTGMPIIEDCAHAFLSKDSQQQALGTKGDFAIYSIGQGKFPSIGDGGLLQVNNQSYLPYIEQEYTNLFSYSKIKDALSCVAAFSKSILHKPLIYRFILPIKKRSQDKKLSTTTYGHVEKKMATSVYKRYREEQPYYLTYLQQQQNNTREILQHVQHIADCYIPFMDTNNYNCFMLPIVANNRDAIIQKFAKQGVEIAPHFAKCIEWGMLFGYEQGNCEQAENLAKKMLVIPVHYNLSKQQLHTISKALQ